MSPFHCLCILVRCIALRYIVVLSILQCDVLVKNFFVLSTVHIVSDTACVKSVFFCFLNCYCVKNANKIKRKGDYYGRKNDSVKECNKEVSWCSGFAEL